MKDRIDALHWAQDIEASTNLKLYTPWGSHEGDMVPLLEPILSYLTGELVEEVSIVPVNVFMEGEALVLTGYQYVDALGNSPVFPSIRDLSSYMELMLKTVRTISMRAPYASNDLIMSNGERTGLFAIVPNPTLKAFKGGPVDEASISIQSAATYGDLINMISRASSMHPPHTVVRIALSVWSLEKGRE